MFKQNVAVFKMLAYALNDNKISGAYISINIVEIGCYIKIFYKNIKIYRKNKLPIKTFS